MKVLFVIAPQGYQDKEYEIPKKIFSDAGIEIDTASQTVGLCQGKLGGSAQAQLSLSEVKVQEYQILVFVGGPGAVIYQHDAHAHLLAQEAARQNKILAAICIAPTILAYAGVLRGRRATVWNADGQQERVLQSQGAIYSGEKVTVDGEIITANGPEVAEEFGKTLLRVLRHRQD